MDGEPGRSRPKKARTNMVSFLAAAFVATFLCCSEQPTHVAHTETPEPTGTLTSHTGCKEIHIRASSPAYSSSEDCIRYSYRIQDIVGPDTFYVLDITHVNAAFNCCPDQIVSDIFIDDGVIRITEGELGHYCTCLCLYDVNYQFTNVTLPTPIRIIEPYLPENREELQFVLYSDAIAPGDTAMGDTCLVRDIYPWGY